MSEPPDQVLGREDLAKMTIFSHGSAKSKLKVYERMGVKGSPLRKVGAYVLRKAGYTYPAIAEHYGVHIRTVRRWVDSVSETVF